MSEREALSRLIFDNQGKMRNWEGPNRELDLGAEFEVLKSVLEPSSSFVKVSESITQENLIKMFKLVAHLAGYRKREALTLDEHFALALRSTSREVEYYSSLICYYAFKSNLTSVPEWLKTIALLKLSEPMSEADDQTASYFLYGLLAIRLSSFDRILEDAAVKMLWDANEGNTEHWAFGSALVYITKVTKLYPEAFVSRDDFFPALESLVQKRCIVNPKTMKRVAKLCSKCANLGLETIKSLAPQLNELCVPVKDEDILNLFGRKPDAAEWYADYLYKPNIIQSLKFVYEYNHRKNPSSFTDVFSNFLETLHPSFILKYPEEVLNIVKAQLYGEHLNVTFLDNLFKFACNEVTDFTLAKELIPLQILFIQHLSSTAEEQRIILEQFVINLIRLIRKAELPSLQNTEKMAEILTLICKLMPEKAQRMQEIIVKCVTDPDLITLKKILLASARSPMSRNAVPELMLTTIDNYASLLAEGVDLQERAIHLTVLAEEYAKEGFDYRSVSVEDLKNPDIYAKEFISLIVYRAVYNLTAEQQSQTCSNKGIYRIFLERLKTSVLLDFLYGESAFQVKQWILSYLSKLFSYQVPTREFDSFERQLYMGATGLSCSPFLPLGANEINDLTPFVTSICFRAALELVVPNKRPTDAELKKYLHQVYYADLPDRIPGVTLFGGTTLLNSDQRQLGKLFMGKRIVTILHELAHKVRKMEGDKYQFLEQTPTTKGMFYSGVPGKKDDRKNKLTEGGVLLENYLFGSFASFVNSEQLEYIIMAGNWQQPLACFKDTIEGLSGHPGSAVYALARSPSNILDLSRSEPVDSLHLVNV